VAGDRADRELLFEALAVHLGFITRDAAAALLRTPSSGVHADSETPLGAILIKRAVLTAEQCAVVRAVTEELLIQHGGDLRCCFDTLSSFGPLRRELERRKRNGRSSEHPTLPSIPINGEQAGIRLSREPGPSSPNPNDEPNADLDLSVAPEAVHGDADEDDWVVGSPTSTGMRFHVLRPHAQGGIGKVSVAFDAELQREVALKQIKPERADDADSRARFLLEAEVTGRLEHPGIVPVYGLGVDDSGRPFYAMRFVRGTSLEEAIRQFHRGDDDPKRDARARVLELRQLLDRFADVCHTVAYAHSRGVLHRDLKPANILLGPFNESLVVDWGLAKVFARLTAADKSAPPAALPKPPTADVVEDDSGDWGPAASRAAALEKGVALHGDAPLGVSSSSDTAAGTAFGTPAYMSPEQAEGRLDQLGPASDVYSLGAVLYTLLSGRAPFEYVWCDVTALIDRVRLGEFPPPRKVNARVPHALEAVCLKAMALRPEDRYATAKHLAGEIERWLADEPVESYRERVPARLARWGRRHKPVVAGLAALLVTAVAALSAGILAVGREQRKTELQRLAAVQQRELVTEKAESLRRRDAVSRVNLAYREYLDDNVALADELLAGCPSDLREWEWEYARRLGHSELRTFSGSSQKFDVWAVAFSPDCALLACGSGPWGNAGSGPTGEMIVREVQSGGQVFALAGLIGAVQALAFSPDGHQLAVASGFTGNDHGARLAVFEMPSGRKAWERSERGVQVLSLAYSPDGRAIASGCGRFNDYDSIGFARLRDSANGEPIGEPITGGPGGVLCVSFSPDGRRLALTSRDVADVCDLSSPARPIIHQLRGHVNFVYAVAFSPDGRFVATGGWDKTIRLWDAVTGAHLQTLLGHRGFVRGLAFSADGAQLVSGSEDKSVRRWDVAGGGEYAAFHGHTAFVHCVAFGSDGALAVSGSQDGTVKLWPAAAPDTHVTFRNSTGWVGTVALAPDGRHVASAHNGNIRIWDPRTGEELRRLTGPRGLLGHIALVFSPDGTTLAASGRGNSVNLWDTVTWSPRRSLGGHTAWVSDAAFSPDGRLLATSSEDGTIRLWNVADGSTIWMIKGHEKAINALAFAPDGHSLASAAEDHKAKVWDVSAGSPLVEFAGHVTGVRDLAFSPDGQQIASVGGTYRDTPGAEVKLWDSKTGRETANLAGHTSLVTAVAFFPGGRRLATASDDRTLKLWDTNTYEDVFTLRGHTSGLVSLAISRDGKQVVSGSIDYTAKTWSTADTERAITAELSLRRAAVERVQSLFAKHLLKDDVLGELRAEKSLNPRMRAAAMEIAEKRAENASGLYEAGWRAVARPGGRPDDHRLAVRRLEAACRVVADDPERLAEYRQALALAFYRAGHATRAIETTRAAESISESGQRAQLPVLLAVTAMASKELGDSAGAQAAFDQLCKLVRTDKWANDREAQVLFSESEAVVTAPKSGAGPAQK
jgi:WD40 repeat protein/serine/threonine protein kinase